MKTETRDFTTGNIWSHFAHIAIPALFGQVFSTIYNLTDTFWGAQISTDALAAFSVTFPLFIITIAIGQCFASGGTVLITNSLGAKKEKEAIYYLEQACISAVLAGIIFLFLCLLFSETVLLFLGAQGMVLEHSKNYINTIAFSLPFMFLFFSLNAGLTSRGNTKFMRNILIMNAIINIILDPLFMFGIKAGTVTIIPAMGIVGIALATVSVQALGAILICIKCFRMGYVRADNFRRYIMNLKATGDILWYGLPVGIRIILVSVGLGLVNFFLVRISGAPAVAAYGIGLRIEQMVLIPSFGINMALSVLVGQNNGANNMERIKESYKKALLITLGFLVFLMLPIALVGRYIAMIFTNDPQVIMITQRYLYFACVAFYAYQILSSGASMLQGMKRPITPTIIHAVRQLVFPWFFIPLLVYVLDWGIYGVFTSVVITVWLAALLMNFCAIYILHKRIALQKEVT